MVNEINQMTLKVRQFSEERDWLKFHNPKDLAIALALEASEVLEHFRFKEEGDRIGLAEELADVLNVLLRLADILEIDIVDFFDKKIEKNALNYPIEKAKGNNLKYTELN
ncbi:nucleotide pyrophosphohydrolase [Candidatus Pacearchaeota archaeon]|nr:nucleotide pyrophosphohydrolase [Candidatus Pacearchaeota archaeon]|tara:strand:- start:1893 stop:2222 length:330 start_codon:yes stop_codon:yes gene_type:complete